MRLAAFVLAALWPAALPAQELTLILHHFMPATGTAQSQMLEPWAERVEAQSEGRIAVEIYPSMSLGGRPNEIYGQVRDGVVDLGWTLLGYTPGQFPRTEVFELPGVHLGSARDTTVAMNAAFDLVADDFRDVKVIVLHAHDGNLIHSAGTPIRAISDLEGMRLRTPSRTGGWMISEIGAEPVGMPAPSLPDAMARGAVDGALTDFEVVPTLGLQDLTRATTEPADGDRLGTSVFVLAMNRDAYERMPADLRAVIDANSGTDIAADIGALWEAFEERGIAAYAEAGAERIVLEGAEADPFRAAGERVVTRWIDDAGSRGLDGASLVEGARRAIAEAGQ